MKVLLLVTEHEDYTVSFASGLSLHAWVVVGRRAGNTPAARAGSMRQSTCGSSTGRAAAASRTRASYSC